MLTKSHRFIALGLFFLLAMGVPVSLAAQNVPGYAHVLLDSRTTAQTLTLQEFEVTKRGVEMVFIAKGIELTLISNGNPPDDGTLEFELNYNSRPFSGTIQWPDEDLIVQENTNGLSIVLLRDLQLGANTMSTPTSRTLHAGTSLVILNWD